MRPGLTGQEDELSAFSVRTKETVNNKRTQLILLPENVSCDIWVSSLVALLFSALEFECRNHKCFQFTVSNTNITN